jgi:hypothetical protein
VQRCEERRLRTLLIHGATAHHGLAQIGQIDELRFPRRRRPLLRIGLLHVVHEVQPEGPSRAGVERCEDAGLAVGGPLLDVLKARVAQHAHRQVAPFRDTAILRRDRRLANPRLQPLHGFVVTLLDLLVDRSPIRRGCGFSGCEHRTGRQGSAKEGSARD